MSTRVAQRCAMAVTLTWALGLLTGPAAAEGIVVPLQRVENWSFRSELRAWQLLSDPSYTSVLAIPTGADPGGMRLINSHPGDLTEANVVRVGQCIPNIVGYRLSMERRVPLDGPGSAADARRHRRPLPGFLLGAGL